MKYFKIIIVLVSLLMCNVLLAQKPAKIKVRKSFGKLHYFSLPKVVSKIKHRSYMINFSDMNGKKYSFALEKADVPSRGYISGFFAKQDTSDYLITVQQISSQKSSTPKKFITINYQVKDANGLYVKKQGQAYELYYDQAYKIVIIDKLDGDKEVFNKVIPIVSTAIFPTDFVKAKGYDNNKIVASSFRSYLSSNDGANFDSKAFSASTKRAFNGGVKAELNSQLGTKKTSTIMSLTRFKTKDDRLSMLDSINFYAGQSIELFNKQKKTKIYKNAHSKEVYDSFDRYYHLLKAFKIEDVSGAIADEKKLDDIAYGIKTDLFFASMFTSRYDEALAIYNELKKEYEEEVANGISSVMGTKAEISFINVDKFYKTLLREKELYEAHKTFYNFYK